MKNIILFILWGVIAITTTTRANDADINVLSYYAVGNSLDGQPLIDKINVLRFYPVYAMRDMNGIGETDTVRITIYYGANIATRNAEKIDFGRYWQILLPKFQLGESIQRIDVETHFKLQQSLLIRLYLELRKSTESILEFSKTINGYISDVKAKKVETNKWYTNDSIKIDTNLEKWKKCINDPSLIITAPNLTYRSGFTQEVFNSDDIQKSIKKYYESQINIIIDNIKESFRSKDTLALDALNKFLSEQKKNLQNEISNSFSCTSNQTLITKMLDGEMRKLEKSYSDMNTNMAADFDQFKKNSEKSIDVVKAKSTEIFKNLNDSRDRLLNGFLSISCTSDTLARISQQFIALRDTLLIQIERAIMANLSDTNNTGPSVRRSDIVLDTNMKYCRILYRNYKTSLRQLVTLDPAERIGIFRARYIPFAVTGESFHRPLKDRAQAIFEIGLAFGDQIVSGDDFTLPEFSARRLGVAFAISNKFFSDEADIMALALTYDFNSFGSIGIGANFPPNKKITEGYFSFGINRRAFEALLVQMQKIFD